MADANYARLQLKDYEYWTLYLHASQYYLGRAYAWLKRPGGRQRLSQTTRPERYELWTVMREYESAVDTLFIPDLMNYAWLGNLVDEHGGHGHMHLIPRYREPRSFGGHEFHDERWGENYAPYPKRIYMEHILLQIRNALRGELEK